MTVKTANASDLAELRAIAGESTEGMPLGTPASERARMLGHVLGATGFQTLVALHEGAAWGYLIIRWIGQPGEPGSAGLVSDLFVAPERRGQGIGTRLLRTATAECRRRGFPEVRLWVNDGHPAVRTYEREGFKRQRIEMRLEL